MPSPTDPDAPTVGGPSDPDVAPPAPDPGMLLSLLALEAYQPEDDHLTIRGEHRWLYVNARGAWALTSEPRVKIDKDTVDKLRGLGVWIDGRQIVIGSERWELVPWEGQVKGDAWAILVPALVDRGESA